MHDAVAGYWPSRWPGEDGGPCRWQRPLTGEGPALDPGHLEVRSREVIAATMVVLRDPGELFLLRHTMGSDAIAWVERVDPITLEAGARSVDLAGGPTWPGGIAAHANGSLHVVFGNHAHRIAPDLTVLASRELPRRLPYNSFVVVADGHLVTKDFGGVLPGSDPATHAPQAAELLVLDPQSLEIVARCELPEPSIARLSADDDTVYAVGTTTLWRARWDGARLVLDAAFAGRYCTVEGQTYGWDAVLALGAAWFLDNGAGSERYIGTFRGQGISAAPLHLVRVDLVTAAVTMTEICGRPNGMVANPPVVDEARRIVVGYDSSNGVVAAFDIAADGGTSPRWRRDQNHACHPLLFADTGELVMNDHDAERMADAIVVLDIETGEERLRVDAGSAVQSVLFPAAGFGRDFYYCSFATLTRVASSTIGSTT
jgi:hypothetical protein